MAKRAEREPRKKADAEKEPVKRAAKESKGEELSDINPVTPGAKRFSFTPRTDYDNSAEKEDRKRFKRDDSSEKPSQSRGSDFDKPYEKKERKDGRRNLKKEGGGFKKEIGDSSFSGKKDSFFDRPAKPSSADKKEGNFDDKKPGRRPRTSEKRFERDTDKPRPWEEKPKFSKSFDKEGDKFEKRSERKPRDGNDSEKKFDRNSDKPKPWADREKSDFAKPYSKGDKFEKGPERKPRFGNDTDRGEKKSGFRDYEKDDRPFKRPVKPSRFEKSDNSASEKRGGERSEWMDEVPASWKQKKTYKPKKAKELTLEDKDGKIRLNKYISNAGICSRREADELIKSGAVKVNGKIITEMGYRIASTDKIQYGDQTLSTEVKRYLLLNKPKDYITTANDPGNRKTVMELVQKACKERLYPVGRLDRATTGLLLFTNDGELARKLTHPSQEIKKVYHVTLSKNLKAIDMKRIMEGLELEDGKAEVDAVDWVGDGKAKNEIGIELHSGKNRIVRRIFEHLGYEVVKLDRTFFAGLNKKDLARGNFRFLTEKEVVMLRMS